MINDWINGPPSMADIEAGRIAPRVCTLRQRGGTLGYVAWTPTREGPVRQDYAAAAADLRDFGVQSPKAIR